MERIEGLLRELGNPKQTIKTVHVTGAHGLLAFLVVWWGFFLPAAWRLAYHGRSLWLKAMGRGYVLATVGIIVGGLTDHVYFNTQMGLCFWTLGGLTMLCKKLNEED